jgi:hypothetical protein
MALTSGYPGLPRIVSVPSADHGFADAVGVVLAGSPWIDRPAELEDALRPYFAHVQVRQSELSGSGPPTWYVYRDGHFPWRD